MSANQNWVIRAEPRPSAKLRLFCFPYAGVGTSAFRGWAEAADRDIEVCTVQLPGRENRLRERPFASMAELLPHLSKVLSELLDRPYLLYGHSLGGRLAFQVARTFRDARLAAPLHLFVGASPAPQVPWLHSLTHGLTEDDFLREIQRRYGGMPAQIMDDPELRALVVPALRADVTMMETYQYQPGPPFDFGITAFTGNRDPVVKRPSVDEWRHQTTSIFHCQELDGDHFFTQSARPQLLETIAAGVVRLQHERMLSASSVPGIRE